MKITQETFGQIENQTVYSYTLSNKNGMKVTAINYGCIVTEITVPDQNGHFENVVLGHDTLKEYIEDQSFQGAVAGRVAGRIKGGSFELDGNEYTLAQNAHPNHLHGGIKGFNKVVWNSEITENGVTFSYLSPDGEEGYPGNLTVQVTYELNDNNELSIRYEAESDKKTLATLTNHAYFNLSGDLKRDILNHTLKIKSDKFLELDDSLIPTGLLAEVEHTPFDFRGGRAIETGTQSQHPQNIRVGKGYDHPFVLNSNRNEEIVLEDPESGRTLTVETDEPAVVVYTGNSLGVDGQFRGVPSRRYLGICLETQGFPDAIHNPHFPQILLNQGEQYSSSTIYKFGIKSSQE